MDIAWLNTSFLKAMHLHFTNLTLVLLNCFNCIFRHSKLELLTQFSSSNDEKYYYLCKKYMSKTKLLDLLKTILSKLSDIFIDLKHP